MTRTAATETLDATAAIRTPRPVGTVLVTGAASGLGRAVAGAVLAAGGQPLLVDRVDIRAGLDDTSSLGAELAAAPSAIADLADTRAAELAVADLADRAGGLDAVVAAAGTDRCGRLEDVPGAEWDRVVQVNLLGTAAVIRAALPGLRRTPRPDRHRGLHPGPARPVRRQRVLRVQVRGDRAEPRAGRRAGRRGRADHAHPRRHEHRLLRRSHRAVPPRPGRPA